MKRIISLILGLQAFLVPAQEKILILNFLQAGAVPQTINERGKNVSTSGLTFNYVQFNEPKFFRMDATWLVRFIVNGTKDTTNFNDTNKVFGMDLPVFTATYGYNLIKGDDFSLGLGVNLDSRTFYSSPNSKAKNIIDAFNVGFVVGMKIRLKPWLSYTTLAGYDYMLVDATNNKSLDSRGNQIYLQNNFSFLIKGKFGLNIQPDLSFKYFDKKGLHGGQIMNKNIKLGLAYAIP
jgi:hypothetical protein